MPNSRQRPAIVSPSSRRAMNRRRSSTIRHSFQGITLSRKGRKCYPCLRNEVSPFSQEGHPKPSGCERFSFSCSSASQWWLALGKDGALRVVVPTERFFDRHREVVTLLLSGTERFVKPGREDGMSLELFVPRPNDVDRRRQFRRAQRAQPLDLDIRTDVKLLNKLHEVRVSRAIDHQRR